MQHHIGHYWWSPVTQTCQPDVIGDIKYWHDKGFYLWRQAVTRLSLAICSKYWTNCLALPCNGVHFPLVKIMLTSRWRSPPITPNRPFCHCPLLPKIAENNRASSQGIKTFSIIYQKINVEQLLPWSIVATNIQYQTRKIHLMPNMYGVVVWLGREFRGHPV